jgi:hypothetical protein
VKALKDFGGRSVIWRSSAAASRSSTSPSTSSEIRWLERGSAD